MDKAHWNPIFYVAFIPVFMGALYMVLCVIGGICSKEAREARRQQEAAIKQQRDEAQARIEVRKRPTRTGPDVRRGTRARDLEYLLS